MDDPRPYMQMAAVIRKQILDGDLHAGDPTPTITELAATYGHARPTCSHALHVLVDEGWITFIPGHGYMVGTITDKEASMLVVKATSQSDLREFEVRHEIKNRGKITEVHHFYIQLPGADVPRIHLAMDRDSAKELKAHL